MQITDPGTGQSAPIGSVDDLLIPFHAAMKPAALHRVGAEAEKFGVYSKDFSPLRYTGEQSVVTLLRTLSERYDWKPYQEVPGGPVLALERGEASVTLEPGGQVELSGAPKTSIHAICEELRGHMRELHSITNAWGLEWLGIGFQPFARREDLEWVPKSRYPTMRRYLPTKGSRALDMMLRTATVQANFDFCDEEDAMRKLRVSMRLSPIVTAMFANSPFYEGGLFGGKSYRAHVWLDVDPDRQGYPPRIWQEGAKLLDYVEYALDVPMFVFRRGEQFFDNAGQTFRAFMKDGFEGHKPILKDWEMHLNTLFPEVRLKRTIEVRCADSQSTDLACALPAIWTGILMDDQALDEADALTRSFDLSAVERDRPGIIRDGIAGTFLGEPTRAWAEKVLEVARGGLVRRKQMSRRGRDESAHLDRLTELVNKGWCPSDQVLDGLDPAKPDPRMMIERCRI